MVITVDVYKEVRQRWLNGESQRSISRVLGISRNTVKKYCEGSNVPWERKDYAARSPSVLTPEMKAYIQSWLKSDEEEGTPKQHHTARRIYNRLRDEVGFIGGESTVRAYVRSLKEKTHEVFVPLAFDPGEAVQIDWGEASIWLDGCKKTVYLFCARLCYSEAPFVIAYRRQNLESFLDALNQAIVYFGGTPRRVIFDNAKVAVKEGFGARARATDDYAALAAHYGFEPVFCNIASGNEKGLVEGLVGYSRRNFCVPMPTVKTMEELNQKLRKSCQNYLSHRVQGKPASVGELFQIEQGKLYPLPAYQYDVGRCTEGRVSAYSTVRYDTVAYSVPIAYSGCFVSVKAYPEYIEISSNGKVIATHQRCFERNESIYSLEHYLPLLERKGRAIFQAKPVRNNVPQYFLDWLQRQKLTPKELVSLLRLSLETSFDEVMQNRQLADSMDAPLPPDVVQVAAVDLTAYDALYGLQKEVSA